VPPAAIPPSSEARQLLFDTRSLLLTTGHYSQWEAREHGPNMRLNPCCLCFRDQLRGRFPSVLFALVDHHILPDDDDKYLSVYSCIPVCIPRMEACL
jgi:hypothetical protein